MSEKVTGYVLLGVGLLIIAFAALSVFQVFTKRSKPVEIFDLPAISLDASSFIPPEAGIRPPTGQSPKAELIPADAVNQTSNIFIHLFLMGFVASIGYKVSSLGVMLLRPVHVQLKEKII